MSTETKHTPCQTLIAHHHQYGTSIKIVPAGNDIETWMIEHGDYEPHKDEWIEVADLPQPYDSAPELLAALEGLSEVFAAYVDVTAVANGDIGQAWNAAKAAIAAAKSQP